MAFFINIMTWLGEDKKLRVFMIDLKMSVKPRDDLLQKKATLSRGRYRTKIAQFCNRTHFL